MHIIDQVKSLCCTGSRAKVLDYKLNSPSITRRRELSESEGKFGRKQLLKQFIPDSAYGKYEFSVTSKNLSF